MTTPPSDLDQMSRRFVDLWQEQWLHLVSRPESAAAMAKMMEMVGPAQQMMGKFFSPETSRDQSKAQPFSPPFSPPQHGQPPAQPAEASPPPPTQVGAEALAAAFEPFARQLAFLAHRLDALDARLDSLRDDLREKPVAAESVRKKPVRAQSVRAKPVRAKSAAKKSVSARADAAKPVRAKAVRAKPARAVAQPRTKPAAAKPKRAGAKPKPSGRGKSR